MSVDANEYEKYQVPYRKNSMEEVGPVAEKQIREIVDRYNMALKRVFEVLSDLEDRIEALE
jgi:heme oxygenase